MASGSSSYRLLKNCEKNFGAGAYHPSESPRYLRFADAPIISYWDLYNTQFMRDGLDLHLHRPAIVPILHVQGKEGGVATIVTFVTEPKKENDYI